MLTLCLAASVLGGPLDTVTETRVRIDALKNLAVMQPEALGIGVAVWDEHMLDKEIPSLVRNAGWKVVRYPGGSYADLYQWKTHSATKGMEANIQPGKDFDSFMGLCRKSGTTPLITVNYGSNPDGTGGAEPAYAAEWVRYANKTKGYGVKYWEIGNEVYGNGFYNGKGWEVDLHSPESGERLKNPLLGPTEYGRNVSRFSKAMKAEDPTVKVGAVMTTPGGWPDGVEPDWNTNVLKECGTDVDFVVVHWYGEGKSQQEILDSLRKVPELLAKLKAKCLSIAGREIPIWMTEGDGNDTNLRASGALFAADHYMTWLGNGAAHVNWWNLHNGLSHWQGQYGDQGILSSGHTNRGVAQPPANTPFSPYYGVQMVDRAAKPGDTFVPAASDRKTLVAHAVRQKSGRLAVMLINQDTDHATLAEIEIAGFKPGTPGDRFELGRGQSRIKRSRIEAEPKLKVAVPATGIVVVTFPASR
ncbi:MAG TPA: hypothetical protein VGE01_03475 [Fimbriimonas sp.]